MFHMLYTQACFPSRCYSPETFTLQLHFVKLEKENALFLSHDQPLISVSCTLFFFYPKGHSGLSLGVFHKVEARCCNFSASRDCGHACYPLTVAVPM